LWNLETEALFAGFETEHWSGIVRHTGESVMHLTLRKPVTVKPVSLKEAFSKTPSTATTEDSSSTSASDNSPKGEDGDGASATAIKGRGGADANAKSSSSTSTSKKASSQELFNKVLVCKRTSTLDQLLRWRATEVKRFLKQVEKREKTVCAPPETGDTKKACANCSCGRAELEKKHGKEKYTDMVKSGQVESKCGNCYLGDDYRCDGCPFRGIPAFERGEKLTLKTTGQGETDMLMQATTAQVEKGATDFGATDL